MITGLGRFPGEGHGTTHSCVLSGESHGQRSLMCYSPWDCKELDMTEQLTLLWTSYFRFLCSIVLYSIGLYFHHQTHPQVSTVYTLAHYLILSGVFSDCLPSFPSSILDTFPPGERIFQCPVFLLFHDVHRALVARIFEWVAISSSSGPCFIRTLHYDPSVLGGSSWHGS